MQAAGRSSVAIMHGILAGELVFIFIAPRFQS